MNKLIAKFKIGSHLYGLQHAKSDEDYMGIFIPSAKELLGLNRIDEVDLSTKSSKDDRRNTAEDIDEKVYSIHKYLTLALNNNPNILEVLFATPENILITSPEWEELVANRDKIISKKVFKTFTGYANAQKKKLTVKKERYTSLIISVEMMEKTFSLAELGDTKRAITEEESKMLNKSLSYYKGKKGNCESFHKGMPLKTIYDKLVEERDNYGWRVKTDSFDKLGYDVKFAYHLIRILSEGEILLKTGELHYPISGDARDNIINVREGNVEYEELLDMYDKYHKRCLLAIQNTALPEEADFEWANNWLVETQLNSFIK